VSLTLTSGKPGSAISLLNSRDLPTYYFAGVAETQLSLPILDHISAGATHVCIQPLDVDDSTRPSTATLERLAPLLREV
jgi:hypothetical protein